MKALGTAMRGVTTELSDLESALRALEISTNPTLSGKRSPCPCQGTTHEVLAAAPNCLSCGKIICIREGLGPCTFCGTPLLTPDEVQAMARQLREDAGREKMVIHASQNRKAEVAAKTPRPFAAAGDVGRVLDDESLRKAQEHRDRLLGFQATSAQRTRIIDQAADFDVPTSGANMWATPAERALQLKRQQKTMRMMDWHAKDDYEKRKVVVSIDIKGRKVVREMRKIEAPEESDDEETSGPPEIDYSLGRGGKGKAKQIDGASGGTYSRNPLLAGLIKPVFVPPKEKKNRQGKNAEETIQSVGGYAPGKWRRVQDSLEDNENVILDGGIKGGLDGFENSDEIPCG